MLQGAFAAHIERACGRAGDQTDQEIAGRHDAAGQFRVDMSARKYKAFISYSWSDRAWGEWLHRTLETYRTPKLLVGKYTPLGPAPRRLHPIFKDREEEAAGHGIGAAIEEALDNSEFLIVLCSPRSAKSQWVNREVAYFKTHHDKKKILALIVDGEPGASNMPGREAEECFPKTLLYEVDADLQPTDKAEDFPLAADARKTGDGKRLAKLKLAAAMIGVGLDDLVKRDERRRAVRRRFVMSGMTAGLVVLSGLTVFAFQQRDAAQAAQVLAEKAQAEAEFERDEAFDLIEFMITDFQDPLAAVGKLDIYEKVGERLKASFDKRDLSKLDADALGQQARVNLLIGNVDNDRGDLDAALASYKAAAATTAEQLRRDPDNEQRIFDHSQSVFWVGYIAWQRGDVATAESHWAQYHEQANRLVMLNPDNEDWQAELMYAHSNLGTLGMDKGEAKKAEGHFRESLTLAKAIYGEAPEAADEAIELGQSYSWLGESLHRQARIDEAYEVGRLEKEVYKTALVSNAQHAGLKESNAIVEYNLAQSLIAANKVDLAEMHARTAVALASELLEIESTSTTFKERVSLAYTILGEALLYLDKFDQSKEALEKAISIGKELSANDQTVTRWIGLATAQPKLVLAKLNLERGKHDTALSQFEEVSEVIKSLIQEGKADAIAIRRYCSALAGTARHFGSKHTAWDVIIDILSADTNKHGPEALALLAEAYAYRGKIDEALTIVSNLSHAGYRHPEFLVFIKSNAELKIDKNSNLPSPVQRL